MLPNAFVNRSTQPSDDELETALGPVKVLWDGLIANLKEEHALDGQEWKCYSLKYGWSLRLLRKKRNIVYLSPHAEAFTAMFIFGDKAMKAVRACKLPKKMRKIIQAAPKYPEGTGIRIENVGAEDISAIKKLTRIKLQY